MTDPLFEALRTVTDPTRTPDDFPDDLADRRRRIDGLVEEQLQACIDRHPASGNDLCPDCGRPTPDDCRKCQSATRPNLTVIRGGQA